MFYIIGFFITNLHLGSLGIVNFDLLRARYILVGGLFAFFIITLAYMVRGVVPKIISDKSIHHRLLDVLGYSLSVYGTPLLAIMFLTSLSGTTSSPAIWLRGISPEKSSISLLLSEPEDMLRRTVILALVILGLYTLGLIIVVIINPKTSDGSRRGRKVLIIDGMKGYLIAAGIAVFVFLIISIAQYLAALTTLRSIGLPREIFTNWAPFAAVHLSLYLVCTVILFVNLSLRLEERRTKKNIKHDGEPDKEKKSTNGSFLLAILLLLAILIPIYTLAVYPGIPQQVGGGAVIPVSFVTKDQSFPEIYTFCDFPTYIVDRTPNTTIFVSFIPQKEDLQTFEIPNSQIIALHYYPSCEQ